ncbi:MarR family transcriptional regulator [bacterium SCSIO 12741]|nr:MarR family transcriptional regulator [bacterium SCSIO 12741]
MRIDEEVNNKFVNEKQRFIANLVYTSNWFQNNVVIFLKPYGISFQQFNVLRILRGAGDWLSMNTIKERMIDKTPNTTRLSDKLLDKGFVERERSAEDRRIVYLRISDKGQALLKEIDEADHDCYLGFMKSMTDEEAKTVSDILDRMRE